MPQHKAPSLRIAVIANKTWECDPLVFALLSKDARPASLMGFARGHDPARPSSRKQPQFEVDGLASRAIGPVRPRLSLLADDAAVEVWCIEDWMRSHRWVDEATGKSVPASASSSHEKHTVSLPAIARVAFGGSPVDIVIAFGTAGIPTSVPLNGCVTIGSRVYVHDPWAGAPASEIDAQQLRFGPLLSGLDGLETRLLCPRLSPTLFSSDISPDVRHAAEARFIDTPIHPAEPPRILAGHGYAALSTINICDYDDYVWADEETLGQFETEVRQREIGSMETTHGLIRLAFRESAFLFVSGITDRVPMFNAEVTPRKYAQNFAAAHNAGVTVAHLLPELARLHRPKKLLDMHRPAMEVEPRPVPRAASPLPTSSRASVSAPRVVAQTGKPSTRRTQKR